MAEENPDIQSVPAQDEVEQLKAQAAENWDKFLRATADFENYRKRVTREREETIRYTREAVIGACARPASWSASRHEQTGLLRGARRSTRRVRRRNQKGVPEARHQISSRQKPR